MKVIGILIPPAKVKATGLIIWKITIYGLIEKFTVFKQEMKGWINEKFLINLEKQKQTSYKVDFHYKFQSTILYDHYYHFSYSLIHLLSCHPANGHRIVTNSRMWKYKLSWWNYWAWNHSRSIHQSIFVDSS